MNAIETVCRWVLQASWQAAALAGVILLSQLVLRKRLSPSWRYALWCLLLVRLVLPVSLPSSLHLVQRSWLKSTSGALVMAPVPAPWSASPTEFSSPPVGPRPTPKLDGLETPGNASSSRARPAALATAPVPSQWDWLRLASLVWLAGAGLLLVRLLWTNYRFHRRIRDERPVSDPAMLREFASCVRAFGLKQPVRLVQTSWVDSPAVCGLWPMPSCESRRMTARRRRTGCERGPNCCPPRLTAPGRRISSPPMFNG
jgi:bla regulator protein blaR1